MKNEGHSDFVQKTNEAIAEELKGRDTSTEGAQPLEATGKGENLTITEKPNDK